MRRLQICFFTWGVVALIGTGLSAQIGIGRAGLRADRPARSVKDLRDENLVKQRFDFSCGAAALATLLRYGFGEDVSERQILVDLFTDLSAEAKSTAERTGFSLLDLQRVARIRGYAAEGFKLDPAQLPMLTGPVIVYIEPRGYRHFAVLRGIRGDRAYLADPSRGNIRVSMPTFLEGWVHDDGKGIIFALEPASGTTSKTAGTLQVLSGTGRPEVIAVRELLAIGGTLRPPQLPR